ncbi:BREX-2 system adenine-specific DNA-methyltransferase PglX, partial [Lacisediminihabitans sp.]|uniref:BREX-2 system adenine-specific DNA-methyltransferase PglX n=1 Tax=Lacisediminihabitans sp. TaxID=2787631 RepID=UPI00374DCDC9
LQTPIFVEEFILDQTLTPAIAEFGLTGLKVIDPACGSGHFLLGTFDRLTAVWAEAAPGVDKGERVQRALDSINGVDLNPFAIAIARFRLTVAAIKAAGIPTLTAAPAFRYHLAIGDSLLGSVAPSATLDLGDGEYFEYDAEDLREYADILRPGQYHVVVANPPYITVKDRALNRRYRDLYSTCSGTYALSAPFAELLFRLAKRDVAGSGAGHVGQITSNSFMTRDFGKTLVEGFLSGKMWSDPLRPQPVDLTHIIDTSRAWIPGHNSDGTPTVILVGRPRRPHGPTLRAVLGVRSENGQPSVAADGLVWRDIIDHIDQPGYNGPYVSVADMPRAIYATFPWSLSGGGAGELKDRIEAASNQRLRAALGVPIGGSIRVGADEAYMRPRLMAAEAGIAHYFRPIVIGESVRDWSNYGTERILFPYADDLKPTDAADQALWPWKSSLAQRATFQGVMADAGLRWSEYMQFTRWSVQSAMSITFAFVATHNHFVLDRGGKVFNRSAPVIKLPEGATEEDHYDLLGVLNSSTGLFWLRETGYEKGSGTEAWEWRYEFTGRQIQDFPLPVRRARDLVRRVDETARSRAEVTPSEFFADPGSSALRDAKAEWLRLGRELVALQEELDWWIYVAYGLADADLAPEPPELIPVEPNERIFEIRLAREVAAGASETAWFERHGRTPLTEFPVHWPAWYRDLAERRLAATASSPSLRMLEQPEYKRRWAGASWDTLLADAVKTALLDLLETADLWHDSASRPVVRSVAQMADDLRRDERFRELLIIHTGSQDYDLTAEVAKLLAVEAVPGLAALRYKAPGLEKFRAWERTWELQRAEDRGERVTVPVPPKYAQADFLKTSYWSVRGKLDVPKERFIAFPGSRLPDDTTELYGWAGWDYAERGQSVARLANDLSRAAAPAEQIIPLVGVLIEIEPWLKQWHDEIDARSGVSPAAAVAGITTTLLARLGIGRDGVESWRPAPTTRGRKRA